MNRIFQWLKNRKYSSGMLFFTILTVLTMYFIQVRYKIIGSVTETILTPPQYEEYQRLMLVPMILIAVVPTLFGMWFKDEQIKRSGRLIPKEFNIRVKDLQLGSEYKLTGMKTNDESDKEKEFDFEYTI